MAGSFLPVFWSPVWFSHSPKTMGLLCDPQHPAPTDTYSDWQWWNLIAHSGTIDLSRAPADFRPIVQVIDNFARQKMLGNLFEARVGSGRLLVCTIDLRGKLAGDPAADQLLRSIYAYVSLDGFNPRFELSTAFLDFGAATTIKGVTCLARQDMSNGRGKACEVYLSDDPAHWSSCSRRRGSTRKQRRAEDDFLRLPGDRALPEARCEKPLWEGAPLRHRRAERCQKSNLPVAATLLRSASYKKDSGPAP